MNKEIRAAILELTQREGSRLLDTMQEVQNNLHAVVSRDTSSIFRFNSRQGLCSNCYWEPFNRHGRGNGTAVESVLESLRSTGMQEWAEFSGDVDYPVGGGDDAPGYLYHIRNDLYVGEYGASRRRLAAHLLEWNAPYVLVLGWLFEVEA